VSESGLRLYDPTAAPTRATIAPSPSPSRLAGARAGVLDNGKPNAGVLMLAVADALRTRHGVAEVLRHDMPIAGAPTPAVVDALAGCAFVLVGGAD
jgi:hypothetical protein